MGDDGAAGTRPTTRFMLPAKTTSRRVRSAEQNTQNRNFRTISIEFLNRSNQMNPTQFVYLKRPKAPLGRSKRPVHMSPRGMSHYSPPFSEAPSLIGNAPLTFHRAQLLSNLPTYPYAANDRRPAGWVRASTRTSSWTRRPAVPRGAGSSSFRK